MRTWDESPPEDAGWSSDALRRAGALARKLDTAAMVVVANGRIVWQYGAVDRNYICHSIRKSLLSALYGIYASEGLPALDIPIGELDIDERLVGTEKPATLRDLLRSASGVYLPAMSETEDMKRLRPARGQYHPGTM